eukprot:TRINITY_DN1935_c0_g1_i2.p1 TRINITY_DN1935_c0_g1~~TRINITY_DN1935_c0_g1_i2.p1  ORF type:complete len:377 (-),score=112.69 TRINITY_DN1935_c0_g1_i2:223-1353(-)
MSADKAIKALDGVKWKGNKPLTVIIAHERNAPKKPVTSIARQSVHVPPPRTVGVPRAWPSKNVVGIPVGENLAFQPQVLPTPLLPLHLSSSLLPQAIIPQTIHTQNLLATQGALLPYQLPFTYGISTPYGTLPLAINPANLLDPSVISTLSHQQDASQLRKEILDRKREIQNQANSKYNSGKSVYVGGLPYDSTSKSIEQLFSPYGVVLDVRMVMTKTQRPVFKGVAFLDFEKPEIAKRVVEVMNGQKHQGRVLTVSIAVDLTKKRRQVEEEHFPRKKLKQGKISEFKLEVEYNSGGEENASGNHGEDEDGGVGEDDGGVGDQDGSGDDDGGVGDDDDGGVGDDGDNTYVDDGDGGDVNYVGDDGDIDDVEVIPVQ